MMTTKMMELLESPLAALAEKTEENRVLAICLDIAIEALTHYRRSRTWSHIATDALREIREHLQKGEI